MQVIRIGDEVVAVETRRGAKVDQRVFTRHWAQVKLRRASTPWHPSQLMIGRVNVTPLLERSDCNIKV